MGQFFLYSSSLLAEAGGDATAEHGPLFHLVQLGFYLLLTLVIMFGLMAWAKQGLNARVFKKPITSAFEQLYLFIENMCVGTIGPHGRQFIPFIMTIWMVIFTGNVLALFMPYSPTASLSFNVGMALLCISYVQYQGVRANGLFGHVRHFAGPKLPLLMVPITVMIFAIEILSELMKNVSLSLRLYGNIHGGHAAVEAMNALGKGIYVPYGEFLLPLKILTCVVQAMIFTLLTCVYLSLATHHEEDDAHHDGAIPAGAH
jgi:F-type H+-transporting ATPase subunit a